MSSYHYTASGLENVVLEGVEVVVDDGGEGAVAIANVRGLHRTIAKEVVQKQGALNGREWRFLRTEMGLTQAQLAAIMKREPLTISRWERGETAIDETADALLRLLSSQKLELDLELNVETVTGWTTATAISVPYRIDGRDPSNYRPLPQAA